MAFESSIQFFFLEVDFPLFLRGLLLGTISQSSTEFGFGIQFFILEMDFSPLLWDWLLDPGSRNRSFILGTFNLMDASLQRLAGRLYCLDLRRIIDIIRM